LEPGPYKLYKCNSTSKDEIAALMLVLYIQNKYSPNGKPLAYYWGCELPDTLKDGTFISDKNKFAQYYPGVDFVKDFSQATPSAILRNKWVEITPQGAYQSAARWWMDEQP